MIYIYTQDAVKILDFCYEVLEMPNSTHLKNENITLHEDAKWIISKLKYTVSQSLVLEKIIKSYVKVPITEGVLTRLEKY